MRYFWDKGHIAYLTDVMVKPEYQKQGIGKYLVNECVLFIDNQLKVSWHIKRIKIIIVSAKGKERFYEKLRFEMCPN